jgi:predicted phage terminase large subunit-like protein
MLADTIQNSGKLIINMPPRHGKSELVSKYLPFWFLGNYPDKKVLLTSYEASFAQSWGKKVRDLIDGYGEKLFDIKTDPTSFSTQNFLIENHRGGMSTAGAGGPITGKGADLLIIDDPVKNDTEAMSKTYRDNIWDWFLATAYTRIEPRGAIVIIMTRWHEDDLCGRIIKQFAINNDWNIVKIQAIAGTDDILGRLPGEPLWKDRFSIEKLNDIKKVIGNYWFSALYQQEPSPEGGGLFKSKNFKYYTEDSTGYYLKNMNETLFVKRDKLRIFISVDLAVKTHERADFSVAIVAGITPKNDILILDVIRDRIEPVEQINHIQKLYYRYKPLIIGIESVQFQLSLIQQCQRLGLPIKELKADKDKFSRAVPIAAKMESSMVYFKDNAGWLCDFESELLSFPNGTHDDQVDAFAYLDRLLIPQGNLMPVGVK